MSYNRNVAVYIVITYQGINLVGDRINNCIKNKHCSI